MSLRKHFTSGLTHWLHNKEEKFMKDYNRIANKIAKMGKFSDIHNCGYPTEQNPVNLYFQLCEAYVIGYSFYVSYDWGKWNIDYTLDPSIRIRTNMQHIRGIKTDREMYAKVEEIINKIREQCEIKNSNNINLTE